MKTIGSVLILLGLLLIIFQIAGCQNTKPSSLTDWMNNWGTNGAWAIKIGMVVVGFILINIGGRRSK